MLIVTIGRQIDKGSRQTMPFVGHHLMGPSRSGPIVSIWHGDLFRLSHIHFATESAGWSMGKDFFYMFEESSFEPKKPKADLQDLARGEKITVSEWVRKKPELPKGRRLPVCLKRNGELRCVATFLAPAILRGKTRTFSVRPILNGSASAIKEVTQDEEIPDRESRFFSINIAFKDKLPDVVGRHVLTLEWRVDGHRFRVFNKGKWKTAKSVRSRHVIYTAYGRPLKPAAYEPGKYAAAPQDGTRSGTAKRFDILMDAFGSAKRHPASTEEDKINLSWKIHKTINNNNPPYFNGKNQEFITVDAHPEYDLEKIPREKWPWKTKIIVADDQWLMWVKTTAEEKPVDPKDKSEHTPEPRNWNDASCIGHAQLQKTMMASVGLLGKLAYVLPHTTQAPVVGVDPNGEVGMGETLKFEDHDLFALESEFKGVQDKKIQKWKFDTILLDDEGKLIPVEHFDEKENKKKIIPKVETLEAMVVLMNGNANHWEHYEGCLLSYGHRFLTGGFPTWNVNHKGFKKDKGFLTATELLNWWTKIKDGGNRRFLCWVAKEPGKDRPYFFDKVGDQHFDAKEIRRQKKDLLWEP